VLQQALQRLFGPGPPHLQEDTSVICSEPITVSLLILHELEELYIPLQPLHVLIGQPFILFLSKSLFQIAVEFILLCLGGNPLLLQLNLLSSASRRATSLSSRASLRFTCTRHSFSCSSQQAVDSCSMSTCSLRSLSLFTDISMTFFPQVSEDLILFIQSDLLVVHVSEDEHNTLQRKCSE